MLLFVRELPQNITIALWKMTETSEELFALLAQQDFYRQEFEKQKAEKRKKEWITSKLLAERVCGTDKKVIYDENGKPSLADKSFNISVSHTMDYVVLAASKEKVVGIDIEKISGKVLGLKERFMTNSELSEMSEKYPLEDVLLHWCAKEAAFKMNDERMVIYDDYQVKKSEENYEQSFDFQLSWKQRTYKMNYEKFADFIMVYGSF